MRPIYVDEVISSMRAAKGAPWDGFATRDDATRLYYWLLPLRRDDPFPLLFSSPRAFYPVEFFATLIPLMAQDLDHEWMSGVLEMSDLRDDPILLQAVLESTDA